MRYRVFFRTHPENSWKEVKDLFDSKASAEFYIQAITSNSKVFFPLFQTDLDEAECRTHGVEFDENDCCSECAKDYNPMAEPEYKEER